MQKTRDSIINALGVEVPRENETRDDFIQRLIDERISFLEKYAQYSKTKGFVLGISGGVDSYVAGMLAKLTGYELCLICLPYGYQSDLDDAKECCDIINPDYGFIFNIESIVDMIDIKNEKLKIPAIDKVSFGNLLARQRMAIQYMYANMFDYLVIGCDHATEAVVGFYTKYGDGAADIMPLAGLTKDIIYDMAKVFNAPNNIITKPPAAGLGISETDEDELGIKYSDINNFLNKKEVKLDVEKLIIDRYEKTQHKRRMPVIAKDSWWNSKDEMSLLVIDCQNDFVDGSLGCLNDDLQPLKNIVSFINNNDKLDVVYSQDWHPSLHCSFKENGGTWPGHCIEFTRGANIYLVFHTLIDNIKQRPLKQRNVYEKGKDKDKEEYSAYEAVCEGNILYNNLYKDVVVCGIAAEFCVKETIIDLNRNGYNVFLLKEGLGYVYPDKKEETLRELSQYCTII